MRTFVLAAALAVSAGAALAAPPALVLWPWLLAAGAEAAAPLFLVVRSGWRCRACSAPRAAPAPPPEPQPVARLT